MFITFEGIEGSGKSSLIVKLKKYFKNSRIETFFSKEPGGTDLGKEIRNVLLNPKSSIVPKQNCYYSWLIGQNMSKKKYNQIF